MTAGSNELSRVSNLEFLAEADRIGAAVGVTREDTVHAVKAMMRYRFEYREMELLAIERAYFTRKAEESVRDAYRSRYLEAGSSAVYGGKTLTELGWLMRWGVNVDAVNQAWGSRPVLSGGLEYSKADGLRDVIFHPEHDVILDTQGLCLRKLGRLALEES